MPTLCADNDMNRRLTLARGPVALASAACLLAALTTFGCGSDSSPTAPSATNPTVRSVAPTSGISFGGTEVTITGERFVAGATVTFGGVPGTNIAVESGTTIRATTPAHASGVVDVQVSGGTGSSMLAQAFTFVAPAGTNTPPAIRSLTVKGRKANEPANFADLNETIDVTTIVEDAETPIDKLTFQWTADIGTFSGSGAVVTWAAPASARGTPVNAKLTLIVIENYKAADPSGLPVDKQNTATMSATVAVHDSVKEVGDMAYDFLVAFSNSSITDPNVVLRDFTPECEGTNSERGDVFKNRSNFRIQPDYVVGNPAVTINFGGSCTLFADRYRPGDACAQVAVEWHSLVINPPTDPSYGKIVTAKGIDQVTGVFLSGRWWLCDSDFKSTLSTWSSLRFKK